MLSLEVDAHPESSRYANTAPSPKQVPTTGACRRSRAKPDRSALRGCFCTLPQSGHRQKLWAAYIYDRARATGASQLDSRPVRT